MILNGARPACWVISVKVPKRFSAGSVPEENFPARQNSKPGSNKKATTIKLGARLRNWSPALRRFALTGFLKVRALLPCVVADLGPAAPAKGPASCFPSCRGSKTAELGYHARGLAAQKTFDSPRRGRL